MSTFSGYKTKAFSETQKFFVLDPNTGSPAFVQGSDLIAQITPNSNYVYSESTRATAQATDYPIGSLIQTSGAEDPGDNLASVYLVVASGDGDFPMQNGNELLVVAGDDTLREQLAAPPSTGQGATLVNGATVYVESVAELEALSDPSNNQQAIAHGSSFIYSSALSGWVPETSVSVKAFGAAGDGITDDSAAIQAAVDSGFPSIFYPSGTYLIGSDVNLTSNQSHIGEQGSVIDGGPSRSFSWFLPVGATNIIIKGLEFTRLERMVSHSADVDSTPVSLLTIDSCYVHDCNQGVYISWFANNVRVQNCKFKNIAFEGATSAILIGKQESPRFSNLFTQSIYHITNNEIESVENTGSSAVDTHGIFVRGYSAIITGNTIKDVVSGAPTGTGCEGIYIVTWYSKVSDNTLYNAGNREASLVIKGGADDGVIPTGSFGFNNIVTGNSFYYDNSVNDDASAFFSNADYNFIYGNLVCGFGDAAFKLTDNGNRNEVSGNYIVKFTGSVVFNITDSAANIINNIVETPESSKSTLYTFFINSTSDSINNVFINGNNTTIDNKLTSIAFYNVYFNANTNDISSVYANANCKNVNNSTTACWPFGFNISSSASDILISGRQSGTFDELVRFINGEPSNLTIDLYDENNPRTVNGSVSVERGENGKTLTNSGAVATVTAALPAARPNLEFVFIRTDSQVLRVDPNGSETIRGGGAGKYLSLDSDGASVTLKCVSSGLWEIISSTGSTSFEA